MMDTIKKLRAEMREKVEAHGMPNYLINEIHDWESRLAKLISPVPTPSPDVEQQARKLLAAELEAAMRDAMEKLDTLAAYPNHPNRQEVALQGWNRLNDALNAAHLAARIHATFETVLKREVK